MADIRPFRAIRPRRELAREVASPPYDVLSSDEARAMASGNPNSFLHVSKPEIDLPPEADVHAPEVYERAAANFRQLIERKVLVRDPLPYLFAYRQTMGEHVQIGLVAGASVDEYDRNQIRKHELTRRDKEDDRTRHVDALNANAGPVFLTYRRRPSIDAIMTRVCAGRPEYDFTAADKIGHTVWVIRDAETIRALRAEFAALDVLYVADGHHRSAAASRVAAARRAANPKPTGAEGYNHFLTVIFPHNQMKILDYNRVVNDLAGQTPAEFLARVGERFEITPTNDPKPRRARTFGMFLEGRWHALQARPGTFPAEDPVAGLDVSILQNNLLAPVLEIADPRTDKRIDFVGGIRGLAELERRVRGGAAVAFALHPTSIEQLMAIADAGQIMPPKSTWFEPKLRSGLIVRPLD